MFNLIQKWNFPSNNYGQIFGIADSGVETFKGTPIKSLAREICQNSLDAALENDEPTRIEFRTFELDPRQIPDYNGLEDALNRALDFWSQQQSTKAKTFFKITMPMMSAGIISGAILSWVTMISELSTAIILYSVKTQTLTVSIYTSVIRGQYGVAAALSTVLTVLTVISLLVFNKFSGGKSVQL